MLMIFSAFSGSGNGSLKEQQKSSNGGSTSSSLEEDDEDEEDPCECEECEYLEAFYSILESVNLV